MSAHLVSVASLLAGLHKELSAFSVGADVRRKAALVSHVAGILAVLGLDDLQFAHSSSSTQ